MNLRPIFILRQLATCLLLAFFLASPGWAATLYDRSLAQFQARVRHASPTSYSFVVLGDSRGNDEVFAKALRLAASYDPLFILHGGDYSEQGGEQETSRFLSLVQENLPEIPLFVVMGNHENRAVFASRIGPFDFTLNSSRLGLTLVALDNSRYKLTPEQLDYLRAGIKQDKGARFVAMHVPPFTKRWSWHTFTAGADELEKTLSGGQVKAAFFSHVHLYDRSEFGGTPAIITGGAGAQLVWAGFPGKPVYHILLVRVTDGQANCTMVPLR